MPVTENGKAERYKTIRSVTSRRDSARSGLNEAAEPRHNATHSE